jgi:hypothetical protein
MRDTRTATARSNRLWIVGIAFSNSVGFSATTALPFWIGGAGREYSLDAWTVGLVATLQLLGCAAANLVSPFLGRRISIGRLGACAAALSGVADLLTVEIHSAFAPAMILSGACLGLVLGATNRLVGASAHAQRGFSDLQICEVLFAGSVFMAAPLLIGRFELAGLFLGLAGLKATAAVILFFVTRQSVPVLQTTGLPKAAGRGSTVAIIAFAFFFVGEAMIFQQLIKLGMVGAHIDAVHVGGIMTFGLIGSGAGAVTSRALSQRSRPGLLACAGAWVLIPAIWLIVHPFSWLGFAVGVFLLQTMVMVVVPNVFGLLAVLDSSGRRASIGPAALLLGSAIAPALATALTDSSGLSGLITTATVLIFIAGCAFLGAERMATFERIVQINNS